jgi:hypothetical protein
MSYFEMFVLGFDSDLVDFYRDRCYRLSIENDLLTEKVDTYEQLVVFMRRKYKKLEDELKHLKSVHRSCRSKNIILYR